MQTRVNDLMHERDWDYEKKEYRTPPFLTLFDELDEPNLSYEFNTMGVFIHKPSGRMWYATTSGCSCPSPYEEYFLDTETFESDMDEIKDSITFQNFEDEAMAFCASPWSDDPYYQDRVIPLNERRSFVEGVREIFEKKYGKK